MIRLLKKFSPLLLLAGFGLAGAVALAQPAAPAKPATTARIVFAGGCFWCMEPPFDVLPGVIKTISGYIGGSKKDPTYQQVSSGSTGHTEAVEITFDPSKVSVEKLLDVFWHNIDPSEKDGQFCDKGSQYRTGIFYVDEAQKKAAEASRAALSKSKPFKEPIVPYGPFVMNTVEEIQQTIQELRNGTFIK